MQPRQSTDTLPKSGLAVQGLRYGAVGLGNTVLGFGVILIAHHLLGLGIAVSNALGYGAGLCLSFLLNRAWTFAGAKRRTLCAVIGFALVTGLAFAVNLAVVHLLLRAGLPFAPAQGLAVITYSVISFMGLRHAVFNAGD